MPAKLTPFGRHLKKLKLPAADVATALDITRSYVQALSTGTMTPGLKLAIEIQWWSKGAVPADSWVK